MKLVSASQMRQIDRQARVEFRVPEIVLMEHAGAAVARVARRWFQKGGANSKGSHTRGFTFVLAGPGANGGDGFVAARHLDNWGIPVEVLLVAHPTRIQGVSRRNLEILERLKVPIRPVCDLPQWIRWVQRKRPVRLVIDALLGTGVSGSVREPMDSIIQWLNGQRYPVIAVDLPSGLCADTGEPCGVAVKASVTVTLGLPKKGLYRGQGPRLRGRLRVVDISLPKVLIR